MEKKKIKAEKLRNNDERISFQLGLLMYIALLQVGLFIIEELVPVTSESWNTNLEPWFHVPVVVDDCCPLDLPPPNTSSILPEPNQMPPPVES